MEYHNEREAADAQLKLGQLRYQGSIRTYLTEFQALNNFARATGKGLWKKIDLAMLDSILDMRFNQNPDEPTDDEGFMNATYRAGIQVEKNQALKTAREASKVGTAPKDDRRKDGQNKGSSDNTQKGKGEKRTDAQSETGKEGARLWSNRDGRNKYGGRGQWPLESAAFEGVVPSEKREHSRTRGCYHCGRNGHRAAQCYAATTLKETNLPTVPWKVSAGVKRQREPEEVDHPEPPPKIQKTAAVDVMEADLGPLWESEEEDF